MKEVDLNGKTIIAWDAHCLTYLPASEVGQGCPMQDNGGGNPHTLRKRRAFICPGCGDCFFTGPAFMGHLIEYVAKHDSEAL